MKTLLTLQRNITNSKIVTHTLYEQTPEAWQSSCPQEVFQFLLCARIQAVKVILKINTVNIVCTLIKLKI